MRIVIPNTKGIEEAKKIVGSPNEDLFRSAAGGIVQITDVQKGWSGDTMAFSFKAGVAFFSALIEGTVAVTEKDVTVDVNFPDALKRFITEDKLKGRIEERYKALLS